MGTGVSFGNHIRIAQLPDDFLESMQAITYQSFRNAPLQPVAGVKKSQLKQAEDLGADHILALDDDKAMAGLGFVDAVADTVGGKTAEELLAKVKQGGIFGPVCVTVGDYRYWRPCCR